MVVRYLRRVCGVPAKGHVCKCYLVGLLFCQVLGYLRRVLRGAAPKTRVPMQVCLSGGHEKASKSLVPMQVCFQKLPKLVLKSLIPMQFCRQHMPTVVPRIPRTHPGLPFGVGTKWSPKSLILMGLCAKNGHKKDPKSFILMGICAKNSHKKTPKSLIPMGICAKERKLSFPRVFPHPRGNAICEHELSGRPVL